MQSSGSTSARATFVLHAGPGADADLARTRAVLSSHGVSATNASVISQYTTSGKKDMATAFIAALPADAYLVYADVDELFEYPCAVLALLASKRLPATCATMVDRVGRTAELPALAPTPHISEQLPACAVVRGGVATTGACLLKITLLAARPGAPPRFESSHRASAAAAERRAEAVTSPSAPAPCRRRASSPAGFALPILQAVAHQQKVAVHAAVGDHTNAQTYKDYLRLIDDPSSPRPSFTPLIVDQISTGFRVSCRRVCPTCDLRPVEVGPRLPGAPRRARHEASVAALAQTELTMQAQRRRRRRR